MGCACEFERRLEAVEEKLKNVHKPLEFADCGPTRGEQIAEKLVGTRHFLGGLYITIGGDGVTNSKSDPHINVGERAASVKRYIAKAIDEADKAFQ